MKDCEKLIVVYYVNIAKQTTIKAHELVTSIRHVLDEMFDDSVKSIVVPINEGLTHIEFCRPGTSSCETIDNTDVENLKELI